MADDAFVTNGGHSSNFLDNVSDGAQSDRAHGKIIIIQTTSLA